MEDKKCEHKICGCMAVNGSDYCSEHCENAASMSMDEITCDCGCPGCS